MNKTNAAIAGLAALALALPSAASAGGAFRGEDFTFDYSLAKMATDAGAKAEFTRLRREVRAYCDSRSVPRARAHGEEAECRQATMRKAAAQLPQPLQALYRAR